MNLKNLLLSLALTIIFLQIAISQIRQREVAFTFDDLPATQGNYKTFKYITDNLLAKLKVEKIPAIGFVNEQKLFYPGEIDKRTALLKHWLNDGHELGNHTFSHIFINNATFEQYTEDLIRGETVTKMLLGEMGKTLVYFRHTQLRTGPSEEYRQNLSGFLKSRGYKIAPVTIDNNDYIFAEAYQQAKGKSDKILEIKIVSAYIEYMEKIFVHFENLSRDFLGYEVKQTLLLHANELNADHLDKLVEMLKKRGYKFITIDEALKDKAYQLTEASSKRGLSWLHRWMIAKGLPINEEPGVPAWIGGN